MISPSTIIIIINNNLNNLLLEYPCALKPDPQSFFTFVSQANRHEVGIILFRHSELNNLSFQLVTCHITKFYYYLVSLNVLLNSIVV